MKTKHTPICLTIAALAVAGLSLTTTDSRAQELLAIDFGAAGAEAGFVQQNSTNFTHSTAAGDLTVDLSGVQGIFNFETTGANDIFYRDFYFKNGGTITLTLSGPAITANTEYELSFWSYYGVQARNTTFAPSAGTTGPSLGPIANGNDAPTGLDDERYTISGTYTSDATGALTILVGGTGNRPAINGLRIVSSGSGPAPIAIKSIGYDPETNMLELTWTSSPGEKFIARYSRDLADFSGTQDGDLEDGIDADEGETTTKTFDLVPPGLDDEGRVYFRVEKQAE